MVDEDFSAKVFPQDRDCFYLALMVGLLLNAFELRNCCHVRHLHLEAEFNDGLIPT